MIEIQDLYKLYGTRRAVGPLSASIEQGEIVGLLGLNGAGKTTTLRILACDLLPSAGTVKVGGLDVVEEPHRVRSLIGYLPDTPPLYPEMTVRELLEFAARLRDVPAGDLVRRVGEALELTRTVEVAGQAISSLSHGFRQRVGIAQAIVHRPRLVVLDEPISGLDPVQIVEMRELVRSLGGEHTVLVSSHILHEISETCDRILVIDDGVIVESGTEQELAARLGAGVRVEVTVGGSGDAEAVLRAVAAVREVESIDVAEAGARRFRVTADTDPRDALVRALVAAGVPVLGLGRAESELESVFTRLVTAGAETQPARRSPRRRRAKPATEPGGDAAAADEPQPGHEEGPR